MTGFWVSASLLTTVLVILASAGMRVRAPSASSTCSRCWQLGDPTPRTRPTSTATAPSASSTC